MITDHKIDNVGLLITFCRTKGSLLSLGKSSIIFRGESGQTIKIWHSNEFSSKLSLVSLDLLAPHQRDEADQERFEASHVSSLKSSALLSTIHASEGEDEHCTLSQYQHW